MKTFLPLACFFLLALFQTSHGSQHESRLIIDLMSEYDPLARPVKNESAAVNVTFSIILQTLDICTKKDVWEFLVWHSLSWKDEYLVWNPKEYGGITDLHLKNIWKPDLTLYTSAEGAVDLRPTPFETVIFSDGSIILIPPNKLLNKCPLKRDPNGDVRKDQECSLKYGSWTYNGFKINLVLGAGGVDVSEYVENRFWKLKEATLERQVKYYDCCPDPYPSIKATFKVEKRV